MRDVAPVDLKPLELLIAFSAGLSTLALVVPRGGPNDRLFRHLAVGGYALAALAALLYAALFPW